MVSSTKGGAKWSIIVGAMLLVLGIAFAIQSAGWQELSGPDDTAIGSYLVVLAAWQLSGERFCAAVVNRGLRRLRRR